MWPFQKKAPEPCKHPRRDMWQSKGRAFIACMDCTVVYEIFAEDFQRLDDAHEERKDRRLGRDLCQN